MITLGGVLVGLPIGAVSLFMDSDGLGLLARVLIFPFMAQLALIGCTVGVLWPFYLLAKVAGALKQLASYILITSRRVDWRKF